MHDVESLLSSVDHRPISVTFGRARLAIHPVTLIECLRLIADHPALKPLLFPTAVDIARFESLIAEGRDGLVAFVARATRKPRLMIRVLPDQLLLPLFQVVAERTLPDGFDGFFKKPSKSSGQPKPVPRLMKRGGIGLSPDDPLVEITKSATWLRNLGRTDAYDLSPRQIGFAVRVADEDLKRSTRADAVAVAIGTHGDKKAWKALDD